MRPKDTILKLFNLAGITVDGSQPHDIQVHDERFYRRVLAGQELGLGESYMDGWWDAEKLDEFIAKLLSINVNDLLRPTPQMVALLVGARVLNKQSKLRAKRNAEHHYNIGNDLYEKMLDKNMIYSCGYFKDATNLDDAQTAKLDLICRKLHLEKGMTVLDIGCGWGGFAKHAASKYGVSVTGTTPAAEQVKLASERTKGMDIKIIQKDYRDLTGKFDRIVSIGMFEHVGPKNHRTFFEANHRLLNNGGIMLHHTIGFNKALKQIDGWTDKYIFPGGSLPSLAQIAKATEKLLITEDVQNFGPYYDPTLMAWFKNFDKAYPQLKHAYDERFYRMWKFYLLASAAGFRTRQLQLYQVVFRKIESTKAYEGVR